MQESYPNPNVQGNPYIYLAVYSSIPVYEMMVRGIGVMRRREDSWLNATQILKVAGVDKGKRTKFLEKDIAQGVHEKVQGGYGRYQGTWIPFERAVELANAFSVAHLLAPLFDYTPPPPPVALHHGQARPPPLVNPYATTTATGPGPSPYSSHPHPHPQQNLAPQSAQDVLLQARQQGLIPEASSLGAVGADSPPIASTSSNPNPANPKRTHDAFDHHQDDVKRFRPEYHTNGAGFRPESSSPDHHHPVAPVPAPVAVPVLVPSTNFRTSLRKSNKNPVDLATVDPNVLENHRTLLKAVFSFENEGTAAAAGTAGTAGTAAAEVPDLSLHLPADLPADLPIDENYHTALHWAAALGRLAVVQAFLDYGADRDLGNNVGETPLIRAILVTNNADQDSFARLVEVLAPSLRTVDHAGRSVLHHCALVAGVRGRAASARYYLETVLVHIVAHDHDDDDDDKDNVDDDDGAAGTGTGTGTGTGRRGRGRRSSSLRDLIDAQDAHGDTALNIAARVGNRALVRMLLDVGADKLVPNKLGLRPTDFGVDEPDLVVGAAAAASASASAGEHTLYNLAAVSTVPHETSTEVLESIHGMVNALGETFAAELAPRVDRLRDKREELDVVTKDLAASRLAVTEARARSDVVAETRRRIRNLERAIGDEDAFDWTGRTELDGEPADVAVAGPGFTYRGPGSTLTNLPAGISIEFDTDPPTPAGDDGTSLVHLARLDSWYGRVESLLRQRIDRLAGNGADLEAKLQRILADCCGVALDDVDDMVGDLVRSLEADPSAQDMPKLAAFLSRIKDGSLT